MRLCSKCQEWKSPDEFGKGSHKDGLSYWCKACYGEYNRQRKQTEEYLQRERVWVRDNKRKHRQDPEFVQREREGQRGRNKLRRQDEEYKQKENEYRRNRRKDNPEYRAKEQSREHNRRALTKEGYTPEEWIDLCNRYGNRCLCCKEQKPLTVDHVLPISKGGTNTIDNLQPLCLSCNSRKQAKIIDYR